MRVLFAGGTGFIGKTFIDYLSRVTDASKLKLTLLSRDPQAFLSCNRRLVAGSGAEIIVSKQSLPELTLKDRFDVLVHGAEVPANAGDAHYVAHASQVLRSLLKFAQRAGAKRFVYLSSGAVYTLDPSLRRALELQPDFANFKQQAGPYACSKYLSELEIRRFSEVAGISCVIIRIFNVASRHVPLSKGYALGNFVSDVLNAAQPAIRINGSGRDQRSFIAGRQLTELLVHCLQNAPDGTIYNACSPYNLSILELAQLVREISGIDKSIQIASPNAPVRDYVGVPNLPPTLISTPDDIRREIEGLFTTNIATL